MNDVSSISSILRQKEVHKNGKPKTYIMYLTKLVNYTSAILCYTTNENLTSDASCSQRRWMESINVIGSKKVTCAPAVKFSILKTFIIASSISPMMPFKNDRKSTVNLKEETKCLSKNLTNFYSKITLTMIYTAISSPKWNKSPTKLFAPLTEVSTKISWTSHLK